MVDKNVELEPIYNLKYKKRTLIVDYFNKLFSGTPLLKIDLLRKRQKIKGGDSNPRQTFEDAKQ